MSSEAMSCAEAAAAPPLQRYILLIVADNDAPGRAPGGATAQHISARTHIGLEKTRKLCEVLVRKGLLGRYAGPAESPRYHLSRERWPELQT